MTTIPLAKPAFDHRELEAVSRVLASGWVVQGPEVEAFEQEIATLHSAKHCIAVSSGTAALHVAYLVLGIGSGDAVFVPSFAWPSAANMAIAVGARPVFVDVLPNTYNVDPADLRRQIQNCIEMNWGVPRVVVPVHEFGLAADLNSILQIAEEFHLQVIEDAACALGAKYGDMPVGTSGRMGIFSFHPRKAITTGEGGAIVTNDSALAEACRSWRNHGQVFRGAQRAFSEAGFNYRMTEFQAAIGRVQLGKFGTILSARRTIALHYFQALENCPGITLPARSPEHTWQTFMLVLDDRFGLQTVLGKMADQGIGAGPGSVAAHTQDLYIQRFGYERKGLPVSARLESNGLALPLYSTLTEDQVERCATALRRSVQ